MPELNDNQKHIKEKFDIYKSNSKATTRSLNRIHDFAIANNEVPFLKTLIAENLKAKFATNLKRSNEFDKLAN